MQSNSYNRISSLSNSFSYNIIINIFDCAAISTKLVLCLLLWTFCLVGSFLIFFNMIGKSMSLCKMNSLVLILLLLQNMLVNILKTTTKIIWWNLLAITRSSLLRLLLINKHLILFLRLLTLAILCLLFNVCIDDSSCLSSL